VPRDTPTSRAISRFECFPVECRWRISAQSSNLITFHNGWWPYFQLAFLALFSVGVNICRAFGVDCLASSLAKGFGFSRLFRGGQAEAGHRARRDARREPGHGRPTARRAARRRSHREGPPVQPWRPDATARGPAHSRRRPRAVEDQSNSAPSRKAKTFPSTPGAAQSRDTRVLQHVLLHAFALSWGDFGPSDGVPDDQPARQDWWFGIGVAALDQGRELGCCRPAEFPGREFDAGEARVAHREKWKVVKTGDGELFWHADAQ
jgi:hypothetical protein